MKHILLLVLAIVGTLGVQTKTEGTEEWREAVLLHNIKELNFSSGHFTTSRRLAAIPQLDCIGGSAKGHSEPLTVRCVNIGSYEPHWRCEAALEDTVKLGPVTVTCEGYSGPSDPYVLRDSCGLKYTLEYTGWFDFMIGYSFVGFKYFVLNPLKWFLMLASIAFVGLVVVAAIRRPAHRNHAKSENGEATKAEHPQRKTQQSEEGEQNTWKGRLRERHNNSPVKESHSPSGHSTTGLAAR